MTPALYALALYTGLLGLMWIWLANNVGRKRIREKVFMGDEGNIHVIRAMRGHANFVEAVPLALVILIIAALIGAPTLVIHIAGAAFCIGRFLHAYHFVQDDALGWQRIVGTILTALVIVLGSLGLIGHSLMQMF